MRVPLSLPTQVYKQHMHVDDDDDDEICIAHCHKYTVFQKSDAKIQIIITTANLIRIKYPLSIFNYHLSDVNVANFNKIHRIVSEQQHF